MTVESIRYEFSKCTTKEQVETTYKRLVKLVHPDNGGSAEEFVEVQKAKSARLNHLERHPDYKGWESEFKESSKNEYRNKNGRYTRGYKENTNRNGNAGGSKSAETYSRTATSNHTSYNSYEGYENRYRRFVRNGYTAFYSREMYMDGKVKAQDASIREKERCDGIFSSTMNSILKKVREFGLNMGENG